MNLQIPKTQLTRLHKRKEFVVLESVCSRKVDDMIMVDFRAPSDCVPF